MREKVNAQSTAQALSTHTACALFVSLWQGDKTKQQWVLVTNKLAQCVVCGCGGVRGAGVRVCECACVHGAGVRARVRVLVE